MGISQLFSSLKIRCFSVLLYELVSILILTLFFFFSLFFAVILLCMAALIFPIGFYINEVGGQPYKLPNNTVVGSSYVLFVLSIFFTIVGLLFAGKVCLPGWWMLNCGTLFWKRARHQNCILRRMPRRDYQTLTEKRNALTFSHYALWIKKRRAFPITKYRQRWLISWAYLMQSGLHCDRN